MVGSRLDRVSCRQGSNVVSGCCRSISALAWFRQQMTLTQRSLGVFRRGPKDALFGAAAKWRDSAPAIFERPR
jgi:hypothetical protein